MAVAAVSLVIISACTSFPELSLDEQAGADGSPAGPGADGSATEDDAAPGTTKDAGGGTGADGSTPAKDATAVPDSATGPRDAAPVTDAAPADTGPDPCAAMNVDCTGPATMSCAQCAKTCKPGTCGMFTPSCCAIHGNGNGNDYKACCYAGPLGSCMNPGFSCQE